MGGAGVFARSFGEHKSAAFVTGTGGDARATPQMFTRSGTPAPP
jgi:hypothetical protein